MDPNSPANYYPPPQQGYPPYYVPPPTQSVPVPPLHPPPQDYGIPQQNYGWTGQESTYPDSSGYDYYSQPSRCRQSSYQSGNQMNYGTDRNMPDVQETEDQRQNDSIVETQQDTVFVQNLPKNCTREDVKNAFGCIGVIKSDKRTGIPKIWIYKDKQTGEGKGEATVTYDDDQSAKAAITWFDKKEVLGKIVSVSLAFRKRNPNYLSGRGGSRCGGRNNQRGGNRGYDNRGGNSRQDESGGDNGGPMKHSKNYRGNRGRNGPY